MSTQTQSTRRVIVAKRTIQTQRSQGSTIRGSVVQPNYAGVVVDRRNSKAIADDRKISFDVKGDSMESYADFKGVSQSDRKELAKSDLRHMIKNDFKGMGQNNLKEQAKTDSKGMPKTDSKGMTKTDSKGMTKTDLKGMVKTDFKGSIETNLNVKGDEECICERPDTKVFCRGCGFFVDKGRVMSICSVHPSTFYLLDMNQCPKCNSSGTLQELHGNHRDWLDLIKLQTQPKTEPETESIEAEAQPDPSKNFFKRASVKIPLLTAKSDNARRPYAYSQRHPRSWVKK